MIPNEGPSGGSPDGRKQASLTAELASSNQIVDTLQAQLRSQSVEIDHLEADILEQRTVVKNLRLDAAMLQTVQRTDAHDLIHLAGRLLALTQAVGAELDNSTKQIFRRRGWTTGAHETKARR